MTTTSIEFEGPFPLWMVVLLGFALVGAAVWMARRDRRVADRPRLVWVLFCLRLAAVMVLLWMLAGPTRVVVTRTLHKKTVGLFVDTSASMGLVDGVDGSGNVSRWASSRAEGLGAERIRVLEESLGRWQAAFLQLQRFAALPESTPRGDSARALLSEAVDGLTSAMRAVDPAAAELADSGEREGGLSEILRDIQGQVLPILRAKELEFRGGKTLAALERSRWLPDTLTQLSLGLTQARRLADHWTQAWEAAEAKAGRVWVNAESKLSRLEKVDAFLSQAEGTWLKEIREKAVVLSFEFGDGVVAKGEATWDRPAGAASQRVLGGSTRLGGALQQMALAQTSQPLEAAILITDGGQNAGRDPRELAGSLGSTALYVVPIGNTKMQRDVILHHTHAPKTVLKNDQVVVDSFVTAYDCAGETLQVELLADDAVVERQPLRVTGEVFDSRVQFRWKAGQLGRHRLVLRVSPVKDERTPENNQARMDVQVMEDKMRVLLADHFPRWETRYLLNLFKRDERIEFEQLLFEPQRTRNRGARSAFPTTLEEWARYRVVILGDLLPSQLTPATQKLVRDYVVETGGNLILVAGEDAMPGAYLNQPLGSLLPVESVDRGSRVHQAHYLHLADDLALPLAVQITDDPGASGRVWSEMSQRLPIYSISEYSKAKPTAHSLIWASPNKEEPQPGHSSSRSFLCWQYAGAGRVVFLAAPVTYQLRYREGDTFHYRFWGQLLRWAVARDLAEGSVTVRLATDKSRYEQGEPVEVAARLRQIDGRPVGGAAVRVEAVHEGSSVLEIALKEDPSRPGNYRGTAAHLPVGQVTLTVKGDRVQQLLAAENFRRPIETTIAVDPSGQLELRHPLANLALLRDLADACGGMVVPPTGLHPALSQWNLEPEKLEKVQKNPLWNRWDWFWMFIGCLSLEWAGRKYIGLS